MNIIKIEKFYKKIVLPLLRWNTKSGFNSVEVFKWNLHTSLIFAVVNVCEVRWKTTMKSNNGNFIWYRTSKSDVNMDENYGCGFWLCSLIFPFGSRVHYCIYASLFIETFMSYETRKHRIHWIRVTQTKNL